jgi:hypothetical protein
MLKVMQNFMKKQEEKILESFKLMKYKFAKLVLDSNDTWLVQVSLI